MIMYICTSVAPEPRLGSARILSKKLGSARAIFQKSSYWKNWQKRAYLRLKNERFGFDFEFEFSCHKSIFNIVICSCLMLLLCLGLVALTFYIWSFRIKLFKYNNIMVVLLKKLCRYKKFRLVLGSFFEMWKLGSARLAAQKARARLGSPKVGSGASLIFTYK